MKLEFIKGNYRYKITNRLFLNGVLNSNEDGIDLGFCCLEYIEDKNGKITRIKKVIKLVKQERWYLYIPTFIHEYCHYLLDYIFPYNKNRKFISHRLIDIIFNLDILFNIFY
jgi:hypothetical protein